MNATQTLQQAAETLREVRERAARKARLTQARFAFEATVCELRKAMGEG